MEVLDPLEAEELCDSLDLFESSFEGSRSLSCTALDSTAGDNDGGFPAMGWYTSSYHIVK